MLEFDCKIVIVTLLALIAGCPGQSIHDEYDINLYLSGRRGVIYTYLHLGAGGESIRCEFDINSKHSWVISHLCKDAGCNHKRKYNHFRSETFKIMQETYELNFAGETNLTGYLGNELFKLDHQMRGIKAPVMVVTSMSDSIPSGGVLGLGVGPYSYSKALHDNYFYEGDPIAINILRAPDHLNRIGYLHLRPRPITGGISLDRVKDYSLWSFHVDSTGVGGNTKWLERNRTRQIALDTTSPYSVGPADVVSDILKALDIELDDTNHVQDCKDSYDPIIFSVGTERLAFRSEQYLRVVEHDPMSKVCEFLIKSNPPSRSKPSNPDFGFATRSPEDWTLGSSFLSGFTTALDYSKNKIILKSNPPNGHHLLW